MFGLVHLQCYCSQSPQEKEEEKEEHDQKGYNTPYTLYKQVILKHEETLHELVNGEISAGEITCFKHKMETSTTNTGNYFHYFVKTLEDGLPKVEVDVGEVASSSYW